MTIIHIMWRLYLFNHVVAAIEAEDGRFYRLLFWSDFGVFHLCAERAAAFNMFQQSGQTTIKHLIVFAINHRTEKVQNALRTYCEFLMQLSLKIKIWIYAYYEKREIITLGGDAFMVGTERMGRRWRLRRLITKRGIGCEIIIYIFSYDSDARFEGYLPIIQGYCDDRALWFVNHLPQDDVPDYEAYSWNS